MDTTDRHADLQARIDAARRRLAEDNRNEWAEIGNLLEGLSEEMNGVGDRDDVARRGVYDRVERELASIHARLGGDVAK